jgi:hypothetical protein
MTKKEFRVTIDAEGNQAAEEFLNTLNKVAQKAEFETGISVTVERLESTETDMGAAFSSAGDLND